MSERKRQRFTKQEVEMRLSRRRFAMATTGAAMVAMGSSNAWGQDDCDAKCQDTKTLLDGLSVAHVFDKEANEGKSICSIISRNINKFSGDKRTKLENLRESIQARDDNTDVPLCYRDFFITTGTTSTEVLAVLESNNDRREAIKDALCEARQYFHLPMLRLPGDHDPVLCKKVIDGWNTVDDPTVAGLVATFGDDLIVPTLFQAPDYDRDDVPWLWRAHLLGLSNLLGMTAPSRGRNTNYAVCHQRKVTGIDLCEAEVAATAAAGGNDECAFLTPSGTWSCASSPGDKCILDDGEPSEGSDLCNP